MSHAAWAATSKGSRPTTRGERLRASDLNACAARAHFPPGVHDAEVAALAPVSRVQGVSVCDVDPGSALAAPHHVGVVGVVVGQNPVVAAPRDDHVVLAVADPLEDPVVAAPPVAGYGFLALDQLALRR